MTFNLHPSHRRTLSRLSQARAHLSGVLQEGQRSDQRGVSTIPLGDGWWLSGKNEAVEDAQIYPFTVATSEEEIQVRRGGMEGEMGGR